jgi:hypothetical protein
MAQRHCREGFPTTIQLTLAGNLRAHRLLLKTHLIHTLEAELTPSLGLNCIQDRLSRVQLQIVYDDDGNRYRRRQAA